MSVACFLLEPTRYARHVLFRTSCDGAKPQDCSKGGWHHARVLLPAKVRIRMCKPKGCYSIPRGAYIRHTDKRWPRTCDACGERLPNWANYHQGGDRLWRRADTGEETALRDAPPGALYYADWLEDIWPGPDGRTLYAKTPGGEWCIDGPASNCTRPDDWRLPAGDPGRHRCWIRHGEPPMVTVDKQGNTCAAGGGSIVSGSYHGFLQNGQFT